MESRVSFCSSWNTTYYLSIILFTNMEDRLSLSLSRKVLVIRIIAPTLSCLSCRIYVRYELSDAIGCLLVIQLNVDITKKNASSSSQQIPPKSTVTTSSPPPIHWLDDRYVHRVQFELLILDVSWYWFPIWVRRQRLCADRIWQVCQRMDVMCDISGYVCRGV